mmetsp:Transcript_143213/g.249780  ORF Transcript_143213/g.249780 Transcript_143213/m.249780 type:complete len:333 (-) Transcript_143213:36-1034(-)
MSSRLAVHWRIVALLSTCEVLVQASCDLKIAVGLTLSGLEHYSDYNGAYDRGPRVHTVHEQPTFWRAIGTEGTCTGSLKSGDCRAMSWVSLENGNESEAACQKACEAERTNGCCRFGRAWRERGIPKGCAMGNGKTFYDWSATTAQIAKCSGQAFIFYCQADRSWNLAPPSAWDIIDDEKCYDAEKDSYYHSVAIGPRNGSLKDGFEREWGANLARSHYVSADARISYQCPGDNSQVTTANEASLPTDTSAVEDDDSQQAWVMPVMIGGGVVVLLLSSAVAFLVYRSRNTNKEGSGVNGVVLPPNQEGDAGTIVVGRPLGPITPGAEKAPEP